MQDVFEPTANFGGEVFEPMNFDGDYSNFGVLDSSLQAGASAMDLAGKLAESRAKKKEAEARLKELEGKRGAELRACETAKENNFAFDPKKTKNRIRDCKKVVNSRNDKDEAEQKQILNKQIDIESNKVSLQKASLDSDKSIKETDSKNKKNLIIGLSIGGGVLILGTILFFVLRKK